MLVVGSGRSDDLRRKPLLRRSGPARTKTAKGTAPLPDAARQRRGLRRPSAALRHFCPNGESVGLTGQEFPPPHWACSRPRYSRRSRAPSPSCRSADRSGKRRCPSWWPRPALVPGRGSTRRGGASCIARPPRTPPEGAGRMNETAPQFTKIAHLDGVAWSVLHDWTSSIGKLGAAVKLFFGQSLGAGVTPRVQAGGAGGNVSAAAPVRFASPARNRW